MIEFGIRQTRQASKFKDKKISISFWRKKNNWKCFSWLSYSMVEQETGIFVFQLDCNQGDNFFLATTLTDKPTDQPVNERKLEGYYINKQKKNSFGTLSDNYHIF